MKEEFNLSDKRTNINCCKCGPTEIMIYNENDVKKFIELLKYYLYSDKGLYWSGKEIHDMIDKLAGEKLKEKARSERE